MRLVPTRILPVLVASAMVTGCANSPTQQEIGTGVGAVAGGVIGSLFGPGLGKVVTTAAGGLLGGWAGHAAGGALDDADKEKAAAAAEKAQTAPIGETVSWNNPQSGHSGSTTVTKDSVGDSGNPCRDYQSTVTTGDGEDTAHGTACRQPDGSWTAMR